MKERYVWIVQCNLVESTDDINVFSSKKRALEWLDKNQESIEHGYGLYSEPMKTLLNPY